MTSTIYKLIDGAFFSRLLEDYGRHLGVDLLTSYKWSDLQEGAVRTIFYDSLPARKPNQSDEDFRISEQSKEAFLNRLRKLPNMQVRDGLTRLRTKSKRNHMSQVLEQKGVDTWIAVDALRYALTGLADEVHIYTSDADLYPVFEALQDTRCRGVLFYEEGRTASELVYSADRSQPLKLTDILSSTDRYFEFTIFPEARKGKVWWKSRCGTIIEGDSRFEFVFNRKFGLQWIGVNYYEKEVFIDSTYNKSSYMLADWINGHGFSISYAAISEILPSVVVKDKP